MVFMPASVKKGDIFAGSSSADVPVLPAAKAEPVIIASAIAPIVSNLKFIWEFLSVEVIGINDLKTNGIERKQFLRRNIY
jgi:hypothetical protein